METKEAEDACLLSVSIPYNPPEALILLDVSVSFLLTLPANPSILCHL